MSLLHEVGVPTHYGSGFNKSLVYVGPPAVATNDEPLAAVVNGTEFEQSSVRALAEVAKTKKGAGGRWVYHLERLRAQCVKDNETNLGRCMATLLTRSPPQVAGRHNLDGPLHSCEAYGRECIIMVDVENAYIMGKGSGRQT